MTFTIWGNGGKFEWIIRDNGDIVARSGMIFKSYGVARRALGKYVFNNPLA